MVVSTPPANLGQAVSPSIEPFAIAATIITAQGDQPHRAGMENPGGFATLLIGAVAQANGNAEASIACPAPPLPGKKPTGTINPGPKPVDRANKSALSTTVNNRSTPSINPERTAGLSASPQQSPEIADDQEVLAASQTQLSMTSPMAAAKSKAEGVAGNAASEPSDAGDDPGDQAGKGEKGVNSDKTEQTADYHKDSSQTTGVPTSVLAEAAPAFTDKMSSADNANEKETAEAPTPALGTVLSASMSVLGQAMAGAPSVPAPMSDVDDDAASGVAHVAAALVAGAIATSVETQGPEEQTTVHLLLEPPGLGSVRVHISANGQSISARVNVQEESTRQLLESQVGLLRDRLMDRGMTLTRFVVTCDGGGSRNPGHQAPFEQSAERQLPPIGPLIAAAGMPDVANGLTTRIDVIA